MVEYSLDIQDKPVIIQDQSIGLVERFQDPSFRRDSTKGVTSMQVIQLPGPFILKRPNNIHKQSLKEHRVIMRVNDGWFL